MRLYHVSLSVPQLEIGMEALARDLGVTWRPIIESRKTQTDEAGREKTVEHRLAYSEGGPPAIELMQRMPGEGPDGDSVTGMVIGFAPPAEWPSSIAVPTQTSLILRRPGGHSPVH